MILNFLKLQIMIFIHRYAYAVSSALHDVGNILHKDFMLQVCLFLENYQKTIIFFVHE